MAAAGRWRGGSAVVWQVCLRPSCCRASLRRRRPRSCSQRPSQPGCTQRAGEPVTAGLCLSGTRSEDEWGLTEQPWEGSKPLFSASAPAAGPQVETLALQSPGLFGAKNRLELSLNCFNRDWVVSSARVTGFDGIGAGSESCFLSSLLVLVSSGVPGVNVGAQQPLGLS